MDVVGSSEADSCGEPVGFDVGIIDGDIDGHFKFEFRTSDISNEGETVKDVEVSKIGIIMGLMEGINVTTDDISEVGNEDSESAIIVDGDSDGVPVKIIDGILDGALDGSTKGLVKGLPEG